MTITDALDPSIKRDTDLVLTNSSPLHVGQSPNGVIRLHCLRRKAKSKLDLAYLVCPLDGPEDPKQSVAHGTLWWHPASINLEVHIRKGVCEPSMGDGCIDVRQD
jgi:hypothetical protein